MVLKLVDSWKTLIGKGKRLALPSAIPIEKEGQGLQNLPGNPNKKRAISQDDDSLSLFPPSDVEDDLEQEKNDPLRKIMFVVNDTEPQSDDDELFLWYG